MAYPVFVAVFAFVLFRETQISRSVIVGGRLVFAGVATIIWNNPLEADAGASGNGQFYRL